MGSMTLRNIPDEVHHKLKQRAAANKRSTEAELREILKDAISKDSELGFGSRMAAMFSHGDGDGLEIERDKTSPRAVDFE